jgi:hypothetical protein
MSITYYTINNFGKLFNILIGPLVIKAISNNFSNFSSLTCIILIFQLILS